MTRRVKFSAIIQLIQKDKGCVAVTWVKANDSATWIPTKGIHQGEVIEYPGELKIVAFKRKKRIKAKQLRRVHV